MESFRECGWAAFLILFLSVLGLAIGVAALALAATRKRQPAVVVGAVALVMALGALAGGPLGAAYGRRVVDDAVSGNVIDPSQRERIREAGYAEAGQCIPVGLSLGTLPALVAAIALVWALASGGREGANKAGL
jgi:MFS family permease